MTYYALQEAQEKAESIHKLEGIVWALDANARAWNPDKWKRDRKPIMRLGNFLRWRKGKEIRVPQVLFFNGENVQPYIDIDITYDLLKLMLEYYQEQLKKEKMAFADMGSGED